MFTASSLKMFTTLKFLNKSQWYLSSLKVYFLDTINDAVSKFSLSLSPSLSCVVSVDAWRCTLFMPESAKTNCETSCNKFSALNQCSFPNITVSEMHVEHDHETTTKCIFSLSLSRHEHEMYSPSLYFWISVCKYFLNVEIQIRNWYYYLSFLRVLTL